MNREKVEYAIADTAAKATVGLGKSIGNVLRSPILNNKFVRNAGDFLTGAAIAAIAIGSTKVFAATEQDADGVFDTIEGQIGKWVTRIGGLVIIFGGVTAGIGVANQDDAGRNRGFMTMAGGAILIAVVGALSLATGG